jgi:hypothetical protein
MPSPRLRSASAAALAALHDLQDHDEPGEAQGGLQLLTHGGSAEGRNEAVETIKGGIIGMIIIMTSSALAKFIITAVVNATYNYL